MSLKEFLTPIIVCFITGMVSTKIYLYFDNKQTCEGYLQDSSQTFFV
jgi:hypothetical protein